MVLSALIFQRDPGPPASSAGHREHSCPHFCRTPPSLQRLLSGQQVKN